MVLKVKFEGRALCLAVSAFLKPLSFVLGFMDVSC